MVALVRAIWAAASFGWIAAAAEVQCWAPDGKTLADNETVVPCNKLGIQQDGVYSSCCRLDGDAEQRDYCLTSGLCVSRLDNVYRREFCTDKLWKSPACVNVCTDPKNGGSVNGTIEMTQCGDGTYCCGLQNFACCGTDNAIVVPVQASVVSSGGSGSSSGVFKSATIGLAVVLGVVFITTAGIITWLLHQNKTMKKKLLEKVEEERHVPPPVVVHPYSTAYESGTPYNMKDASIPGSPSVASGKLGDRRHYSELDASIAATRSEMGSPVQHNFFTGESSHSHPQTPHTPHTGPSQ